MASTTLDGIWCCSTGFHLGYLEYLGSDLDSLLPAHVYRCLLHDELVEFAAR
jgi:hypothetical protein